MRKTVSIFLLCCFGIYHFGYYLYFYSHQRSIEAEWSSKVFDGAGFTNEYLLKIPLSFPYGSDQDDYQVTNTSFTKDGMHFRAIKQKYANDTLHIIYTQDTARAHLDRTVRGWIASVLTDQLPGDSGGKMLFMKAFKDYNASHFGYEPIIFTDDETLPLGFIFIAYIDQVIDLTFPPPELV